MKSWGAFIVTLFTGIRVTRCNSCGWRTRRGYRTLTAHREQRCLG